MTPCSTEPRGDAHGKTDQLAMGTCVGSFLTENHSVREKAWYTKYLCRFGYGGRRASGRGKRELTATHSVPVINALSGRSTFTDTNTSESDLTNIARRDGKSRCANLFRSRGREENQRPGASESNGNTLKQKMKELATRHYQTEAENLLTDISHRTAQIAGHQGKPTFLEEKQERRQALRQILENAEEYVGGVQKCDEILRSLPPLKPMRKDYVEKWLTESSTDYNGNSDQSYPSTVFYKKAKNAPWTAENSLVLMSERQASSSVMETSVSEEKSPICVFSRAFESTATLNQTVPRTKKVAMLKKLEKTRKCQQSEENLAKDLICPVHSCTCTLPQNQFITDVHASACLSNTLKSMEEAMKKQLFHVISSSVLLPGCEDEEDIPSRNTKVTEYIDGYKQLSNEQPVFTESGASDFFDPLLPLRTIMKPIKLSETVAKLVDDFKFPIDFEDESSIRTQQIFPTVELENPKNRVAELEHSIKQPKNSLIGGSDKELPLLPAKLTPDCIVDRPRNRRSGRFCLNSRVRRKLNSYIFARESSSFPETIPRVNSEIELAPPMTPMLEPKELAQNSSDVPNVNQSEKILLNLNKSDDLTAAPGKVLIEISHFPEKEMITERKEFQAKTDPVISAVVIQNKELITSIANVFSTIQNHVQRSDDDQTHLINFIENSEEKKMKNKTEVSNSNDTSLVSPSFRVKLVAASRSISFLVNDTIFTDSFYKLSKNVGIARTSSTLEKDASLPKTTTKELGNSVNRPEKHILSNSKPPQSSHESNKHQYKESETIHTICQNEEFPGSSSVSSNSIPPSPRDNTPEQKSSSHVIESSDNSAVYGTPQRDFEQNWLNLNTRQSQKSRNHRDSGSAAVGMPKNPGMQKTCTTEKSSQSGSVKKERPMKQRRRPISTEEKTNCASVAKVKKAQMSHENSEAVVAAGCATKQLAQVAKEQDSLKGPENAQDVKSTFDLQGQLTNLSSNEREFSSAPAQPGSKMRSFYISSSSSGACGQRLPWTLQPTPLSFVNVSRSSLSGKNIETACQTSPSVPQYVDRQSQPMMSTRSNVSTVSISGTQPTAAPRNFSNTTQSDASQNQIFEPANFLLRPDVFRVNISDSTMVDSQTGMIFQPGKSNTRTVNGEFMAWKNENQPLRLSAQYDVERMSEAELQEKLHDLHMEKEILTPIIELLEYIFYLLGLRGAQQEEDFFLPLCHVEDSMILWNAWKSKVFTIPSRVAASKPTMDPLNPMNMYALHSIDRLFHFLAVYCSVSEWSFTAVDRTVLETNGDLKVLYELFHSGAIEIPADRPKFFTEDVVKNRGTLRLFMMDMFRFDTEGQMESVQRQKRLFYVHLFKNDAINNPTTEQIAEYRELLQTFRLEEIMEFSKKDDILMDILVSQWLSSHEIHHEDPTIDPEFQILRKATKRWLSQTTFINSRARYGPLGALKQMAAKYLKDVLGNMSHEHRTFVSNILQIEKDPKTLEWTCPDTFLNKIERVSLQSAVKDYIVPYRFKGGFSLPIQKVPLSKKDIERAETFQILEEICVQESISNKLLAHQAPVLPKVDLKTLSRTQFCKNHLKDPDVRRQLLGRRPLVASQEQNLTRAQSRPSIRKTDSKMHEIFEGYLVDGGNEHYVAEDTWIDGPSRVHYGKRKRIRNGRNPEQSQSESTDITTSNSGVSGKLDDRSYLRNLPRPGQNSYQVAEGLGARQAASSINDNLHYQQNPRNIAQPAADAAFPDGRSTQGKAMARVIPAKFRVIADAAVPVDKMVSDLKFSPNITRFISAKLNQCISGN